MLQRAALRGADIMQNRSGCRGRCWTSLQAKAFKRQHAELVLQQRYGVIRAEDPVFQRRFSEAHRPAALLQRCSRIGLTVLRSGFLIFILSGCFRAGRFPASEWRLIKQRQAGRVENFPWTQLLQLFYNAALSVWPFEFRS